MFSKMRLTIRSKMIIGYLFVILCLGWAVFGVSGRITELQNEIDLIANRDLQIHSLADQIENHVLNLQSGQRGYILTGNGDYLDLYSSEMAEWAADYNKLHEMMSDNPTQQKNLDAIKANITDWIQKAAEPAILLKKENKNQEIQDFFQVDPGKNFMDQLKSQFESFQSAEMQQSTKRTALLISKNEGIKTELLIYFLLISAITMIMSVLISGAISKTIKHTIRAIKDITTANGQKVARIEMKSKDEVNDLAVSMNELLDVHEQYLWYQTRVSELALISYGVNDVNQLAQIYITKLATTLDSSHGVFYLRTGEGQEQKLVKSASYAAYGSDKAISSFTLGEGLVGQAAVEKKLLFLDSIPDNYMKITSGLGQAAPTSIVIAPISYQDTVQAVIELASLKTYTPIQRLFIETAASNFGVILNNTAGRMEVERLLKESQTQAEELQAQTEELQAQSEELQAQSEELQVQQEELRVSNEQLEAQNEAAIHKASELEKAKKDLEKLAMDLQRSASYKSEFLANMSHELRTPLNSVIILSQMLYENKGGKLTPEEKEYARVILASGQDLLSLIDDILDLSKVEAGKIEILMDEVNVSELPQLMSYNFSQLAQKKGVQFDVVIDSDIPNLLYTDGRRLQQILKNLLSNAFKFTERGSVTLKIHKADTTVVNRHFQSHAESTVLAISVTDTGVGIPKDMQSLIFEAFQQVDGTINRRYGGTGLGLSICREFTKLLGGLITLESQENKGTTFTVYVPSMKESQKMEISKAHIEAASSVVGIVQSSDAVSESFPIPKKPADPEYVLFKGKKVLLVDDDIRNVFALTIALENEGIIVKVASNGKEGLELLQEEAEMDLVLMDIMMPVMDGYEAMQAIRSIPEYKDLPIIALTAKAMKNDREKCLESGASDYITKPLQIDQLFSLMRVWLTH